MAAKLPDDVYGPVTPEVQRLLTCVEAAVVMQWLPKPTFWRASAKIGGRAAVGGEPGPVLGEAAITRCLVEPSEPQARRGVSWRRHECWCGDETWPQITAALDLPELEGGVDRPPWILYPDQRVPT